MKSNPKSFSISVNRKGGAYEPLIENLKGTYIRLSKGGPNAEGPPLGSRVNLTGKEVKRCHIEFGQ